MPNPIDIAVGQKVNERRILLGLSQEDLAKPLGISFQQVQKYLTGANRISSSKLFDIAKILHCAPGDFFPPSDHAAAPVADIDRFRTTSAGLRVIRVLSGLTAAQVQSVLNVASAIADANAAAGDSAQAAE